MTAQALNVYDETLKAQLGENSPFTIQAILDPSGEHETIIYGWFEAHTYNGQRDSANVTQRRAGKRFVTKEVPNFDVYKNLTLQITGKEETYKVDYIERDEVGVQVIWLI